jgi:hypothetical protein
LKKHNTVSQPQPFRQGGRLGTLLASSAWPQVRDLPSRDTLLQDDGGAIISGPRGIVAMVLTIVFYNDGRRNQKVTEYVE